MLFNAVTVLGVSINSKSLCLHSGCHDCVNQGANVNKMIVESHATPLNPMRSRSRSPSNEYTCDLDAILGTSQPVIDLKIPAYETSVTNFSREIANFTTRSTTEITQRRDAHHKELKRLANRAQDVEKETEQCKHMEIKLISRCVMCHLVSS